MATSSASAKREFKLSSPSNHIVENLQTPQRFSDYACDIFVQLPSRKSVKKAIKNSSLLLNGQKAQTGTFVKNGDQLTLSLIHI